MFCLTVRGFGSTAFMKKLKGYLACFSCSALTISWWGSLRRNQAPAVGTYSPTLPSVTPKQTCLSWNFQRQVRFDEVAWLTRLRDHLPRSSRARRPMKLHEGSSAGPASSGMGTTAGARDNSGVVSFFVSFWILKSACLQVEPMAGNHRGR
jgi:hypothetical protein